jgi:hypothetical protein
MQWRTKKSAAADENGSATKASHEDNTNVLTDTLKREGSASFMKALWTRKSSTKELVSLQCWYVCRVFVGLTSLSACCLATHIVGGITKKG